VADAQRKAFDAISPGAPMADVDRAARDYIEKKGFGRYFGHAVGHGVGMAVHEEPTISKNSQGCVRPGMVFTVEPAIYLPKVGGVRIEDMVLVTEDGFEILTR
jgi:Xaa-Pro aminopeptidase